MPKKTAALVASLFFTAFTHARDFNWWANNVHWDEVTSWCKYIIYSPYYLGPMLYPYPHCPMVK